MAIQNSELLRGLQNVQNTLVQYFPINSPVQNAESQYINQALNPPPEKMPTVDEVNQNYTGAKYQIFRDNFPTPSPREFNMQERLYGLKTNYQNLQEKIDALDATKDADKIKTLRQGQNDVADSAKVLRNVASSMGYDINGFGAENNFDEATQRIFLNRERGMAEIADMPSTSAQKRQVYRQARRAGISPDEARAVAESYHDEFREKNTQKLVEGIGAYGMNADGSINQFGQMLMGKLYNENPYVYGNIANGFANPKDVFGVNANLAQATMNNDAAMRRTLSQIESAQDIARLTESGRNNRFNAEQGNKMNIEQAKLQAKIAELYQKTPTGQFQGFLELGNAIYGGDQAKALDFAFEYFGGKGRNSGGNSGARNSSGGKLPPSAGTINGYRAIVNAITSGNDDDAMEMFEGIRKQKADNVGKFYEGWSEEDTRIDSAIDQALAQYFRTEYEGTDEEIQAKRNAAKQLLLDSIMVIGSGYTVKDIQDARAFAQHQSRDRQPENRTANDSVANQNVRNILYPNGVRSGNF